MPIERDVNRIIRARGVNFSPRKARIALIGAALLFAASAWRLRVDPTLDGRLWAWIGIAFFGGGGLFAAVLALLPSWPALRLDRRGLTMLHRFPALGRLPILAGFAGGNVTVPWSEIARITIVKAPQRVVAVVPRNFNVIPARNSLQRAMRNYLQRKVGAIPMPPGLEIPADDLVALFERYRSEAQR